MNKKEKKKFYAELAERFGNERSKIKLRAGDLESGRLDLYHSSWFFEFADSCQKFQSRTRRINQLLFSISELASFATAKLTEEDLAKLKIGVDRAAQAKKDAKRFLRTLNHSQKDSAQAIADVENAGRGLLKIVKCLSKIQELLLLQFPSYRSPRLEYIRAIEREADNRRALNSKNVLMFPGSSRPN